MPSIEAVNISWYVPQRFSSYAPLILLTSVELNMRMVCILLVSNTDLRGSKQATGDAMKELNKQEQRIVEILGADNLAVTLKSLTLYREHLRKTLETPCIMTGIEAFPWKEKYVVGYDDKTEHEALKTKQPSYTDIYELKRFENLIDEVVGITVKVKRVNDNQRFILDLAWLKAVDETSKNYTLLDDYSVWFVNY
jgi:hypothetical protein